MRNKQAFKRGFLRKLASVGMTPSQLEAALEKGAFIDKLKAPISFATSAGGLGLGIALTGGAGAGILSRIATQADDEDVDELKTKELTDEYRRLAKDILERVKRSRR